MYVCFILFHYSECLKIDSVVFKCKQAAMLIEYLWHISVHVLLLTLEQRKLVSRLMNNKLSVAILTRPGFVKNMGENIQWC